MASVSSDESTGEIEMQNIEGQRVPQVTFRTREGSEWQDVTSDDIFSGKNVILFALPGAFTPTCSTTHLPRYNELAPMFQAGLGRIIWPIHGRTSLTGVIVVGARRC
jgi:hypothetical protein